MDFIKYEYYWNAIPVGKENAIDYAGIKEKWNVEERQARHILHELSSFDNGDDYVLIRSGRGKGFYKTDNLDEIETYKRECLNKGKSLFAPIKKINRVINSNTQQFDIENNLRLIRESKNMKQSDVVKQMKLYDNAIDKSMLSKFENGVCLPTPYVRMKLAELYNCEPNDIVKADLYV